MARIRTIKPEFFTSLTVANLPIEARLTFIGLWTHVDDDGRCVDDARLIKAAVWPLDDRVSADVEQDLQRLTESSLILRYKVGGRSYICVRTWGEHQRINRPTRSKLPPPPDGPSEPPPPTPATQADPPPPAREQLGPAATPALGAVSSTPHAQLTEGSPQERNREQGTGNREQGLEPREARGKRGSRIPDDFAVSHLMRTWYSEHTPDVDIAIETANFIDHWTAKSGKDAIKSDWIAAWRTWMRNAQKWKTERGSNRSGGYQPFTNPADVESAYGGTL